MKIIIVLSHNVTMKTNEWVHLSTEHYTCYIVMFNLNEGEYLCERSWGQFYRQKQIWMVA